MELAKRGSVCTIKDNAENHTENHAYPLIGNG